MGLFDKLFPRPKPRAEEQIWKTLTAYKPVFYTRGGGLYECELVRSAIHARATHISKLDIVLQGTGKPALQNKLKLGPNQWMTWSQFMYRLSTILDCQNNAFIVPVLDEYGEASGVFPVLPSKVELVAYQGQPWVRYTFKNGQTGAIEMDRCGIMTKFQYEDDTFGSTNAALSPTMDLIDIQNQGITEGVKSAATYRFMAQLSNFSKAEDLAKERKRFTEENFSAEAEGGGLLLFPNTYQNIKQIDAKPFIVDADQMKLIRENVYEYFGVNEDVLQNKVTGDAWSAFYEGAIEPFGIQFSEVMSRMLFTMNERSRGSYVMATSNRMQYMSNADKLNVSAQMADRGLMSRNEIRQIWNLPPLPPEIGDTFPVRGEYYNLGEGNTSDE